MALLFSDVVVHTVVHVPQHRVILNPVDPAPPESDGFVGQEPLPKVFGRLLVRPEGFVEVAGPLGGATMLVRAVDPIEIDPRLALGAAERLGAHPQLVIQPLDERLDLYARFDVKAVNESQHPSPLSLLATGQI